MEDLPPEQLDLRAGPLSVVYENGDLRYVRLGDREILRRVYVAIRDRNWGTVLNRLDNVQMQVEPDSFRITYDATNRQDEIDFAWRGAITGAADGTITFSMEGEARTSFVRSRIGFCVLHPIQGCAGEPCTVEHADGSVEEGTFPRFISPNQPFLEMRAITHEVAPGVRAEVRFEGDIFEMEDHRNWTDASYKTYCTPLRLPYPVEVPKGTRIAQSVTVRLLGGGDRRIGTADERRWTQIETAQETPSIRVHLRSSAVPAPAVDLPAIGLGVATHGQPLTPWEIERLRALHLDHLRVDLRLSQPAYLEALRRAAREAAALGVLLQVALHLSENAEAELQALVRTLDEVKPPVGAWLVFYESEKSTRVPTPATGPRAWEERWVRLARERLTERAPTAAFVAGTDAYFAELNRDRPPVAALDGVCYSINPQVHAFDDISLVENLAAQAETVASVAQFAGGRPGGRPLDLAVGPVTLLPRFNPNATGPEPKPAAGELPNTVDPRQMSLFGAVWTLGSIRYLSQPEVASIIYYETTGWRGVMETEAGSPLPERFRSLPGSVFPLYHVFADVGEFAGGEAIATTTSHPLRVDGLTLRKDGRTRVLVANMTLAPQRAVVTGLPDRVRVRVLDEANVEAAMREPEAFRAEAGVEMLPKEGALELELRPYAVARIDGEL
jgi:hypothetical protein